MGVTLISMAGRAFRRLGGPRARRPLLVIAVAILIGGGLALWARIGLNRLLHIGPPAVIAVTVEARGEFCGTPSLYLVPVAGGGDRTDYRAVVDVLGGPNRFPGLAGEIAAPVLALPESRRPGVGLGRGLPDRCAEVRLRIEGDFGAVGEIEDGAATTVVSERPGLAVVSYRRPEEPGPTAATATATARFTLFGVDDLWQFGHKRAQFLNGGREGVNVFLYEEEGYLFLNENFAFVRPPNVRRGFVDIHLERMGGRYASSADVVRRRPTSDLELQQSLINLSTVFGIGVSLLVEGVLILLVSAVGAMRPTDGDGP